MDLLSTQLCFPFFTFLFLTIQILKLSIAPCEQYKKYRFLLFFSF